ncbi:MAG: hypothetical protein QM535_20120 [Limnohabitans sp.]|nr:hypothetical protein [Limnohabitans sp.]
MKLYGQWEVRLSEILITKTWYNITEDQTIKIFSDSRSFSYSNTIKAGIYTNIDEIREKINSNLDEIILHYQRQSLSKGFISPQLSNDEDYIMSKKLIIIPGEMNGETVLPLLSKDLYQVLGFDIEDNLQNTKNEMTVEGKIVKGGKISKKDIDLDNVIHVIYVYTDIIKSSIVGDTFTRILRVIGLPSKKYGETIHISYDNPHYFALDRNEVQSIEIDIKDDTGQTLLFEGGRVVTVLHFRKNE